MRLLRRLFRFWLLNLSFIVLAITGCWTHWYPRFQDLGWGLVEMAHVAVGWVALPVLIGYQVHHLASQWGDLKDFYRWNGIVLTVLTTVAFGTGVWLELRIPGGAPDFVRPLHFVTTFIVFAALIIHTMRVWRAWIGARLKRLRPGK